MLGAHPEASNLAVVCTLESEGLTHLAVYKPVAGERPLWDFPHGHLAHRERAAYLVARAGGWDCIPVTVLRDGPLGEGSLQEWVGELEDPAPSPVDVVTPDEVAPGDVVVLSGEDETGRPVVLTHPDDPALRSLAVLDAVLNNSDRKGGHILLAGGTPFGIDNGVSLHVEPKLRTVLWGWAGDPLPEADLERVRRVRDGLEEDGDLRALVEPLLTLDEVDALAERCEDLLASGVHPVPGGDWPSVPWPPM